MNHLLCILVSFLLSAALMALVLPLLRKLGAEQSVLSYVKQHASKNGTPIKAAAEGVVTKTVKSAAGKGIYCIVDHGSGYATLYAHCSELLVSEGDEVKKGQEIALVSSTGNSTGPHLHFELQKNSEPVEINYK